MKTIGFSMPLILLLILTACQPAVNWKNLDYGICQHDCMEKQDGIAKNSSY